MSTAAPIDEQVTSAASQPASKVEPTSRITCRIVAFSSRPAAIVFLIVLSSTKWRMRTSGMTRAAISLNTAASIGELWISPSVGTGRVLPGSNLEVVASGTDLEADEIADAGEVADIEMLVDRPAALAPGARRQFDFSDRVGGDRERQGRSEERRVEKECVSTCSSRWWP